MSHECLKLIISLVKPKASTFLRKRQKFRKLPDTERKKNQTWLILKKNILNVCALYNFYNVTSIFLDSMFRSNVVHKLSLHN